MKTAIEQADEIARLWAETSEGEDDLRKMLRVVVEAARVEGLMEAAQTIEEHAVKHRGQIADIASVLNACARECKRRGAAK